MPGGLLLNLESWTGAAWVGFGSNPWTQQQPALIHTHANPPLAAGVTQPPSPRRHAPPLPLLSSPRCHDRRPHAQKENREKKRIGRNGNPFTRRPSAAIALPARRRVSPAFFSSSGPLAAHAKQPKSLRAVLIPSSLPRIPLPQDIGSSVPKDGRRRQ